MERNRLGADVCGWTAIASGDLAPLKGELIVSQVQTSTQGRALGRIFRFLENNMLRLVYAFSDSL